MLPFLDVTCRDLKSLDGLANLRTLVLDDNLLQSHVVFPQLPCLEHLWVNKNNIDNLPVFIETVAEAFPRLKHLSMMNNLAAPSYFNGGSVESYRDYRLVIRCGVYTYIVHGLITCYTLV